MPATQLSIVLRELLTQAAKLSDESAPALRGELAQISEWLEHGEYGISYESIVCLLEDSDTLSLSGRAAVTLLETGLVFRFKTERPEDQRFDSRQLDGDDAK